MIAKSFLIHAGGVIDILIAVKFLLDKNLNMEFALGLIHSVVSNPSQLM